MAQAIFYALNAIVWIAILSSSGFWISRLVFWLRSGRAHQPLVPLRAREKPRWTVGEFLLMFGVMIIALSIMGLVAARMGWMGAAAPAVVAPAVAAAGELATETVTETAAPPNMFPMLVINTLAGLVAMGVTLAWLTLFTRCSFSNLGLESTRGDVWLGFKGVFWFIPPVLVISLVASLLIPYEHPVLDTLATTKVPGTWVLLFVSTAIIVPLVEEFMFRVLLQGGLQRLADRQTTTQAIGSSESSQPLDCVSAAKQADNWIGDAYKPPAPEPLADEFGNVGDQWQPKAFWPIAVTSLFFALMHLGQGAAPIPLFFFSLGCGYLYRQSGRITAPLIVHMILNGFTLAVEFSRISAGIEPGSL